MTVEFTHTEREWIRLKWEKIRVASARADGFNNEWHKINGELNDYLNRSRVTDIVQRAKIKGESLALSDALASGKWHSAEASRHATDLQLFLKMREIGAI